MEIINQELLNQTTQGAKESPRLRMNHNFHKSLDSKAQRLLNALEPGTVLPIHRHQHTSETYILIRGSLKLLLYSENRELISVTEINPKNGVYGVDIPAGQWHTIEVLESGTVIFEVKEGPYKPISAEDTLL
jgi:cupin fold WbuC family metalloprotein